MALPLIAAIIAGATAIHQSNKSHYKKIEHKRKYDSLSDSSFGEQKIRSSHFTSIRNEAKYMPKVRKLPSDTYSNGLTVIPEAGSIVCCEVYGMFDHTGIWLDDETIIELSNSGLVKAVSSQRFLQERSGKNLFVACNNLHKPIVISGCEQRAVSNLFSYREYDVIDNNCHRFVNFCLSGRDIELTTFANLNKQLAKLSGQNIYWDKVKVRLD
ncbi:MAG: hypothetical protein HWE10_11310 [Gammaproteobacteria bacterium]|nr:hypothetical protein [Gammaproteobacteria bacterium]